MAGIMGIIKNMSRKASSTKRRAISETAGKKTENSRQSGATVSGNIPLFAPSLEEGLTSEDQADASAHDGGSRLVAPAEHKEQASRATENQHVWTVVRHGGMGAIHLGPTESIEKDFIYKLIIVIILMAISILAQYYDFPVRGDFGLFAIVSAISMFILRRHPLAVLLVLIIAALLSGVLLVLRHENALLAIEPIAMAAAAWLIGHHALKTQTQADTSLRKLRSDIDELQRISVRDPLTGLFNRRYAFEIGPVCVAETKRLGTEAHLIMLDIDHFKQVNDKLGHATGDVVLKECAGIFGLMLRGGTDILARIGGEEFIIIMPNSNSEAAYNEANRIRDAVRGHSFPGVPWQITVSLGVVAFKNSESFDSALERVDICLYNSKRSGRNRVTVG